MKLFNPILIIRMLGTILFVETGTFLLCLPVVYIYHEPAAPFIFSALITLAVSTLFSVISEKKKESSSRLSNRDAYIVVSFAWVLFLLAGTLPYLLSGTIRSFTDAFFESSSGFTTTGSTIIPDLNLVSHSILFWRSLTHWIGGIGIIALVIIILPSLRITGYQLFTLESSLNEKIHPKTQAIGIRILIIYLGLTISEIVLLSIGDMDLFESVCYSFGTVATGGFGLRNDSMVSFSPYSQYVVMIFMFFAGISQVVYYYILKFNFSKVRQNEELWLYIIVILIAGTLASSILLTETTLTPEEASRHGFFNIISVITTTGFVSADYLLWPGPAVLLIFLLMFSGASTGSTTGNIKIARHLIVIKSIKAAFTRLSHPNALANVRLNGRLVADKTCVAVISFLVLYLFIFMTGTVVIVSTGSDAVTAASSVAASLGNIGPGLGMAGPMNHYAHFPESAKLIFSMLMIVGRMEIITILTLFTRSFWKL
ncbi:MAG TPA: TrkH family potassium uptake protein [Bacteroidales bacterium]|nr:TrkH family potassium uptake protein [Bacteroidales bacterium]